MQTTRRAAILASMGAALCLAPLMGCAGAKPSSDPSSDGKTKVHVMGVIHSGHRTSELYSLEVLEAAIRKASPDVILTEIPADRIDQALVSFREAGVIDEPRTQVFPEYTDVVFPLSREMGFRIRGTAGWNQKIADDRRAALRRIQNDPDRSQQWSEHRAALRGYAQAVRGRGDDPRFIHTDEFDRLVKASRKPYQDYFDADLGAGGWSQINRAHTDNINTALDLVSGQGLSVLITYGSAHKYKINESLATRSDVELQDTRALFDSEEPNR